MKIFAIILGAGNGSRMRAGINKVFIPLSDIPLIVYSVAAFTGFCEKILVTHGRGEQEQMQKTLRQYGLYKQIQLVEGGDTRQASVWSALSAIPQDTDFVMIHDGARPLVTEKVIAASLKSAMEKGSGVASVPVIDTIKRADAEGRITEDLRREELFAMQTPQSFAYPLIRRAHLTALKDGFIGTDDAALLQHQHIPVYLSEGSRENLKLTTPMDMVIANHILELRKQEGKL